MGWLKAWGEEKTRSYLQGLIRNEVAVTRGHSLQTQFVCAGQYAAAVELYLYTVAGMQRTGCPIGISYPNPTTVASAQSWTIPKAAPRAHAAALFLDFMLGPEGGALVAEEGRIPARNGVKPKFETLNQVVSGKIPVQVLTADDAHRFDQTADQLAKELLLRK
jgi:ABC-type Fe3+ transport system substrate-binding protein